ncbi:siphovirus ReqiPepy6 Gp37-like family protein [Glutamicibacter sp. M10]|uniref:siphovirus ReqiPepy6 Gp37-like family protein n=1 Tax=Glutamicibacter sp. M10 TaxID=3023076 RepID=UPI0021C737F0|nr:siphovirus ReqiPepy6 Gp37-like family protein [Glutamicibacter sp. M10]UXN31016.1 siphovirus ReqiPepy6 Gp37-like family protein [Glutamicibacter sp. M10]
MDIPRIFVFDKDFVRLGEIGAPTELTATPRHMLAGTGTITLPASHRLASALVDANNTVGPRILVEHRGEEILSGWVGSVKGFGPAHSAQLTVQVDGYFGLLYDILAWPNPTGNITAQGGDEGFYRATGPAETVAKNLIVANCARLGLPVDVEPTLGRGATITIEARFTSLADVLLEKLESAGIGLRVVQASAGYRVEAYVSTVWGRTLTETSGSVIDWAWSKNAAQASRVIVGGSGARELRTFRQVVSTATEAGTRRIREHYTDGLETTDSTELDKAGQEYLSTHGPALGLSVTLQESKHLKYGGTNGLHVGDKVSLEVGPGLIIADTLKEAPLTWTADQGVVISQQVGEENPDPTLKMVKRIATLGRQLRILKAGK